MPDAAHSYTPTGRTSVFFIPAYDDNADLRILFSQFADTASSIGGDVYTGVHNFTGGLQKSGVDVVTTTGAQTLTAKTFSGAIINGSTNTLSNIAQASVTSLTTDLASKADLSLTTNSKTANYILVLGDAGESIEMNVATANTLTVPHNDTVAFPSGTTILVIQVGVGQITITPASGVTINSTPGLKLRTQWSVATLIKRGTNAWVVAGDVVA